MDSVEADKAVSEEKDERACVLLNPTLSEWPIESEFLEVLSLADTSGFPAIESKTLLKIPIGPHPYFSINLLRLSNASFIFRRLSSLPSTRLGPNRYVFPLKCSPNLSLNSCFSSSERDCLKPSLEPLDIVRFQAFR